MDKESFTNKVYNLLISLYAQQEEVKIEYELVDKKETKEPA